MRVPHYGWFIMENPIKVDDWGTRSTPILGNLYQLGIPRGSWDTTVFRATRVHGSPWSSPCPRHQMGENSLVI